MKLVARPPVLCIHAIIIVILSLSSVTCFADSSFKTTTSTTTGKSQCELDNFRCPDPKCACGNCPPLAVKNEKCWQNIVACGQSQNRACAPSLTCTRKWNLDGNSISNVDRVCCENKAEDLCRQDIRCTGYNRTIDEFGCLVSCICLGRSTESLFTRGTTRPVVATTSASARTTRSVGTVVVTQTAGNSDSNKKGQAQISAAIWAIICILMVLAIGLAYLIFRRRRARLLGEYNLAAAGSPAEANTYSSMRDKRRQMYALSGMGDEEASKESVDKQAVPPTAGVVTPKVKETTFTINDHEPSPQLSDSVLHNEVAEENSFALNNPAYHNNGKDAVPPGFGEGFEEDDSDVEDIEGYLEVRGYADENEAGPDVKTSNKNKPVLLLSKTVEQELEDWVPGYYHNPDNLVDDDTPGPAYPTESET
eukprot:m.26995 g.26995  ORF g.26995 m.26995 type:complete len:422 (-) comp7852_c0_seq1:1765-3030(-)